MPSYLDTLANVNPLEHFVASTRPLFLGGEVAWGEIGLATAFGLAILAVGAIAALAAFRSLATTPMR